MHGRILVVDDDRDICRLVELYLAKEGFRVYTAYSGEEALAQLVSANASQLPGSAADGRYSLIILDIMLPGIDGFEVARKARNFTDAPILFLSARDTDVDKAVGLGLGADDYVTKPFSAIELVARVKAHLRRYYAFLEGPSPAREGQPPTGISSSDMPDGARDEWSQLAGGPVVLDLRARRAWVRGAEIELTAKEFDLLKLFLSNPGQVFTKAQLFDSVWGEDFVGADNTVMVHIRRLRTKVEEDPGAPRHIKTVWGIGYRFEGGDGDLPSRGTAGRSEPRCR